MTTALSIAQGGTGATTAATARSNLGLGSAASYNADTGATANTIAQRTSDGTLWATNHRVYNSTSQAAMRFDMTAAGTDNTVTEFITFSSNPRFQLRFVKDDYSAEGTIITAQRSGITTTSAYLFPTLTGVGWYGGIISPTADNAYSLGQASYRFTQLYAGSGTINTSDARLKTAVTALSVAEIEAAKALGLEIGTYQFLAAVAEKGDEARHHVGLTVQRAMEILEAYELDPCTYGFICYDKWDERVVEHDPVVRLEDDGTETVMAQGWSETIPGGDRYSFRYDQLNLFIARGLEARIAAIEEKLAA